MLYGIRHIASILLLPFMVTVSVPFWLLNNDLTRTSASESSQLRVVAIAVSAAAFLLGLTLFVSTLLHFARVGQGTLAPWDPPRVLVVEGVYRYVRNPMISGVLFVLLSEAVLTGSHRMFAWLGLVFVINLIYIPSLEETGLAQRFGKRYREYQQNVPRWIPRLSAWKQPPWPGATACDGDEGSRSSPNSRHAP